MIIFKVLGIQFKNDGKGVTRQITYDPKNISDDKLTLNFVINLFLKYKFGDDYEKYVNYEKMVEKSKTETLSAEENIVLSSTEENLDKFKKINFMRKNLISNVSFLCKGSMMNDKYERDLKDLNENLTIHVFTNNVDLKKDLEEVFTNSGETVQKISYTQNNLKVETSPSLEGDIKSTPPKELFLSDELIDKRNKKFNDLLNSPKFLQLVGIYYTEPELFKTLLGFIESGNIFIKKIEELVDHEEEEKDYSSEIEELKSFNIGLPESKIKNALNKFKGDKYLSLRYLICTKSIVSNLKSEIDNSEDNPIVQQFKKFTQDHSSDQKEEKTELKLSKDLIQQINTMKTTEASL